MSNYERAIKIAKNHKGEIIDTDTDFFSRNSAFEIRKFYAENQQEKIYCIECQQELLISSSKYKRVHFKHFKNHSFCPLTDSNFTVAEYEQINNFFKLHESLRHKDLKSKIGMLLSKTVGVLSHTIRIDSNFIEILGERRRPDVYCQFEDYHLVFEIQLSNLPLKYILSRHNFYKKNGYFLIWILDNLEIHNQSTLALDIKYLSKYQNFFKLDEDSNYLRLLCTFKQPALINNEKIITPWISKSISLNQLSFDEIEFQAYYNNYEKEVHELQHKLEIYNEKIQLNAIYNEKIKNAKTKIKKIKEEISFLRAKDQLTYDAVVQDINALNEFELKIFNDDLGFLDTTRYQNSILIKWLEQINSKSKTQAIAVRSFIQFILACHVIKINVNQTSRIGKTLFQAIYETQFLFRDQLLPLIFKRGYELTNEDLELIESLISQDKSKFSDLEIYKIINRTKKLIYVDDIIKYSKILFTIESAKLNKIIGYKYEQDKWLALLNNAATNQKQFWNHIERTYKHYGLWDTILKTDKKGTLKNLVAKIEISNHDIPNEFIEIFRVLYPELVLDSESF